MTTTKLRSLIAAATHTSWVMDDDGRGFYAGSLSVEWMALCSAVAEALPALLDIAERVARSAPGVPGPDGDSEQCCICGGAYLRWTVDGKRSEEDVEGLHKDGCGYIAARALVGGE